MKIEIQNIASDIYSTHSIIYIDGVQFCMAVQDTVQGEKVYGKTRIWNGIYQTRLTNSPKFTPRLGHKMIEIMGIEGFDRVYFHPGNDADDTLGCILLGWTVKHGSRGSFIPSGESRPAYDAFYKKVVGAVEKGEAVVYVRSGADVLPSIGLQSSKRA